MTFSMNLKYKLFLDVNQAQTPKLFQLFQRHGVRFSGNARFASSHSLLSYYVCITNQNNFLLTYVCRDSLKVAEFNSNFFSKVLGFHEVVDENKEISKNNGDPVFFLV